MSVDPALLELFIDTVQIAQQTSMNTASESSYGADTSYKARCEGKRRMVRTPDGREVISMVTTYIPQHVAVAPSARITLPSRFVPQQPKILSIEFQPDETGNHHTVIYT